MKSFYSDLITHLSKESRVAVQSVEDGYYVCDGHLAFKVSDYDYDRSFVPASGLYKSVDIGKGLNIDFTRNTSIETDSPVNISSFFKDSTSGVRKLLETAILFDGEVAGDRKVNTFRVFIEGNKGDGDLIVTVPSTSPVVTAVNMKFLKLLKRFPDVTAYTKSSESAVYFYTDHRDYEFLILPTRFKTATEQLKIIGKYLRGTC